MKLRRASVKSKSRKPTGKVKADKVVKHTTKSAKAKRGSQKLRNTAVNVKRGDGIQVVIWRDSKGTGAREAVKLEDLNVPVLQDVTVEEIVRFEGGINKEAKQFQDVETLQAWTAKNNIRITKADVKEKFGRFWEAFSNTRKLRFEYFMHLPPEIRILIYEYLLVVGKVFPYRRRNDDARYKGSEKYSRPNTQLFAVSRQIRSESEKLYLSKNHFVLPRNMGIIQLSYRPGTLEGWLYSFLFRQEIRQEIRSLSIALSACDLQSQDHWYMVGFVRALANKRHGPEFFENLDPQTRSEFIHRQAKQVLVNVLWTRKLSADFRKKVKLDFLEIDLSRAYCSYGCHRYTVNAASLIGPFGRDHLPRRIDIVGSKSVTEAKQIWEAIMTVNKPLQPAVYFPDCVETGKEVEFGKWAMDGQGTMPIVRQLQQMGGLDS